MPAHELNSLITSDQYGYRSIWISMLNRSNGIDRIRHSTTAKFNIIHSKTRVLLDCKAHHRKSMFGCCETLIIDLKGRVCSRNKHALIEVKLIAEAIGNDQMRDVDGIERSTDDSYAHGCVFVLKETTTRMLPSRPFRQLIHRYSGGALHTRERLEAAHQAR